MQPQKVEGGGEGGRGGEHLWLTGTGDHQFNNLLFNEEKGIIVFVHWSATKQRLPQS